MKLLAINGDLALMPRQAARKLGCHRRRHTVVIPSSYRRRQRRRLRPKTLFALGHRAPDREALVGAQRATACRRRVDRTARQALDPVVDLSYVLSVVRAGLDVWRLPTGFRLRA